MDTSEENLGKAPAEAGSQFQREHGRSNSPVVVYDCEKKTVKVQSKKDAESKDVYQKVKLPARRKEVTLFVDEETKSNLTTESMDGESQSKVLLAQLHLDRLSLYGQFCRFIGALSMLYVINARQSN